jgi:naphthalene 1,2-dioxygenase ferredoxin reductase component
MNFRVRIEQFDREIDVGADETILECALLEGIDYPFSCQQGQCGSCKSLLIAGEVALGDRYNPLALSAEERSRGLILACQAQPRRDCVVSVVEIGGEIRHAERHLECTVMESVAAGANRSIVQLRIDRGGPFNFVAGQYAHVRIGGSLEQRLAMANAPDTAALEFHFADSSIAVGDRVTVRGPYGRAYLHDEHLGPILAVADETGLAPMVAMIRSALALEMPQRLHLYVGTTERASLYGADILRALAATHSRVNVVTAAGEGGINLSVAADFPDLAAFRVYAAGRPAMLAALRAEVIARGLTEAHWAAEDIS